MQFFFFFFFRKKQQKLHQQSHLFVGQNSSWTIPRFCVFLPLGFSLCLFFLHTFHLAGIWQLPHVPQQRKANTEEALKWWSWNVQRHRETCTKIHKDMHKCHHPKASGDIICAFTYKDAKLSYHGYHNIKPYDVLVVQKLKTQLSWCGNLSSMVSAWIILVSHWLLVSQSQARESHQTTRKRTRSTSKTSEQYI